MVENHSSDCGPEIVAACAERDSRVRLILAPPEVRGPGAARNCGLAEARGEWILFLDADDLLEPDYLERRLSVLKSYPDAKIIAGPWKNFYPEAPDVFENQFPNGWKPPFGPPPDSIYAYAPWALHSAIINHQILQISEKWPNELDHYPIEDNVFWFKILFNKIIYWNDCNGALYRKQTENSRHNTLKNICLNVDSVCETLNSNLVHLKKSGKKPSTNMCRIALNVLYQLYAKSHALNMSTRNLLNNEIERHLQIMPEFNLKYAFKKSIFKFKKLLYKNEVN